MNFDNLLRTQAIEDLERHCPPGHYWLRDHRLEADVELVEPLLSEPRRFGLNMREHAAAEALSAWANYQTFSRAIYSAAHPAKDADDPTPSPGMTEDQKRQIFGRYEYFRRTALQYAQILRDEALISHYGAANACRDDPIETGAAVVSATAPSAERQGQVITTDELCEGFADVKFTSIEWRKKIQKGNLLWLQRCRNAPGKRGNRPTQATWWPLAVARALIEGEPNGVATTVQEVEAAFSKNGSPLRRVLNDWRSYRADHPELG